MKDNKDDFTDWLINKEESIKYSDCMKCSKQFTCSKDDCTGLVKFSQTKGYGIPERKEK